MKLKTMATLLIFLSISTAAAERRMVAVAHTRAVPESFEVQQPKSKRYITRLGEAYVYSEGFRQGDACYLELIPEESLQFEDVMIEYIYVVEGEEHLFEVRMDRKEWGFAGLLPIHPDTEPGRQQLRISYNVNEQLFDRRYPFTILDRKFEESKGVINFRNSGKPMSEKTKAFVESCSLKREEALSLISENQLGEKLAHPRGMHHITSSFWKKRKYAVYTRKNGKRVRLENRVRIHKGIDLRGKKGSPVYAMAPGRVVLAQRMFYEGNMVILDHGNGIFSYYMHLSSISVSNGDLVKAGDTIADVGSTGMSTASHLHVSFMMRGVQVDPLTVLSLPLR